MKLFFTLMLLSGFVAAPGVGANIRGEKEKVRISVYVLTIFSLAVSNEF
jgi:hypothetical protein